MQATWKDIDSKESDSTTSKDAWYEQNVAYLNNLVVEHDNLIKK